MEKFRCCEDRVVAFLFESWSNFKMVSSAKCLATLALILGAFRSTDSKTFYVVNKSGEMYIQYSFNGVEHGEKVFDCNPVKANDSKAVVFDTSAVDINGIILCDLAVIKNGIFYFKDTTEITFEYINVTGSDCLDLRAVTGN